VYSERHAEQKRASVQELQDMTCERLRIYGDLIAVYICVVLASRVMTLRVKLTKSLLPGSTEMKLLCLYTEAASSHAAQNEKLSPIPYVNRS
jgi:hypothetical protein